MNNQLSENNIPQDNLEKTKNVFEVVKKSKIPHWVSWVVLGAVVVLASVVIVYSTIDVCNGWKKALFEGPFGIKCPMSVGVYQNKNKNLDVKKENKTQQKNETADWKTYRNEKYGFEIKIHPEWKETTSCPNDKNDKSVISINFSSNFSKDPCGKDVLSIFIYNNPKSLSFDKFFGLKGKDFEEYAGEKSNIIIDGRLAKRLYDVPGEINSNQVIIIPLENEKKFIIIFEPSDNTFFKFNNFLSTFKFIK